MAEERVNSINPNLNNRRLSLRSPQLPDGSMKSAIARIKAVITQLSSIALSAKSLSMVGRAIFTADTKKVPIKEVTDTTNNIENFSFFPIKSSNHQFVSFNYVSLCWTLFVALTTSIFCRHSAKFKQIWLKRGHTTFQTHLGSYFSLFQHFFHFLCLQQQSLM